MKNFYTMDDSMKNENPKKGNIKIGPENNENKKIEIQNIENIKNYTSNNKNGIKSNEYVENPKVKENIESENTKKENKTPEKVENTDNSTTTPIKDVKQSFKTPEKMPFNSKSSLNLNDKHNERTPGKLNYNCDIKLKENQESFSSYDGEEGMISEMEQARLLIAASKTPSKCTNQTPTKVISPSTKRSVENSPVTPGKYKRAELITLFSPKTKRFKQM